MNHEVTVFNVTGEVDWSSRSKGRDGLIEVRHGDSVTFRHSGESLAIDFPERDPFEPGIRPLKAAAGQKTVTVMVSRDAKVNHVFPCRVSLDGSKPKTFDKGVIIRDDNP